MISDARRRNALPCTELVEQFATSVPQGAPDMSGYVRARTHTHTHTHARARWTMLSRPLAPAARSIRLGQTAQTMFCRGVACCKMNTSCGVLGVRGQDDAHPPNPTQWPFLKQYDRSLVGNGFMVSQAEHPSRICHTHLPHTHARARARISALKSNARCIAGIADC